MLRNNPSVPLWLTNARAFERMMIHELPGHDTHPLIQAFFQFTQLAGTEAGTQDETPWCSAFACACVEMAGVASTKHALARSWLKWGVELDEPREGAILVFQNRDHVSFCTGVDLANPKYIQALGGNQNNKVCTRVYDKSRLLSIRWNE